MPESKRLFISYARESEEYRLWVRRLAARFREDGVDARLDHWHLQANDNVPEFMSREVRLADWVLVLCSPAYQGKVRAAEEGRRVSGVGWETRLLTGRMLGGSENKTLAALARGTWAESSPDFLAGQLYYDLSNPDTFGQTYRELLQRITGTYETAPPLGELPAGLETEPVLHRPRPAGRPEAGRAALQPGRRRAGGRRGMGLRPPLRQQFQRHPARLVAVNGCGSCAPSRTDAACRSWVPASWPPERRGARRCRRGVHQGIARRDAEEEHGLVVDRIAPFPAGHAKELYVGARDEIEIPWAGAKDEDPGHRRRRNIGREDILVAARRCS